ncbi:MAG: tetratricopeptide repeat protein [Cyanobacteria bacterium]|nr:tetratricopeptide repeat protein [Cyanobacteriota bacterium]
MHDPAIEALVEALKSDDPGTREMATQELWRRWFTQKGAYGFTLLQRSQDLIDQGDVGQAEAVLTELVDHQPDFAEAWNRRAVLYYTLGDYGRALADCDRVVALVPYHFGALHGMGLCHMALGHYHEAIAAFRRASAVQPHALANQRLILECTAQL